LAHAGQRGRADRYDGHGERLDDFGTSAHDFSYYLQRQLDGSAGLWPIDQIYFCVLGGLWNERAGERFGDLQIVEELKVQELNSSTFNSSTSSVE
jgi:hypothetical protein